MAKVAGTTKKMLDLLLDSSS
jgi:hypothetical protein